MSEFLSSFSKWFSEKTSSPLYFTYLGFLVVWNWKFFQIIFLENGDLFFEPRIGYINSELLFSIPVSEKIPLWASFIIDWFTNFTWHFIPPVILTGLAIKYLPIIHAWAFNIHLTNYFSRKSAFYSADLAYEKGKEQSLKEVSESKDRQIRTQQKIQKKEKTLQKTLTNKEQWEIEYNEFEKHQLFFKFQQIIICIYKFSGKLNPINKSIVDSDIKAIAHTKDLISFLEKKDSSMGWAYEAINLTDKGKFFADKYLEKNPLV